MNKILQWIIIVLLILLIIIMRDIRKTLWNMNYNNELNTQYVQLNKIIERIDTQMETTNNKLYNIQLYIDEIDDILNHKFYWNVWNNTQWLTK